MEERKVRKSGWIALSAMAVFGLFAGPLQAADDVQKCEANKNKVAGKYYFCREKAEAKAILTGDPVDYSKCAAKFDEKWDLWENKVPGACPDNVTLTSDMNTYIAGQAAETAAIISGTMGVPGCGDNQINVAGEQCDGSDLGGESCASLGFAGGSLACASCALDTSGCTCGGGCTGNATVADVLAGKTFSNGSMTGLTGTMPDNGAQTITPGTSNQAITAGYHNGSGYCAGDVDLVAGNIKSGADIFGVAGSVIEASGNATVGDVLAGKTFSNAGGAGTGTMPDNGAQMITPTTTNQTITAGYHNGSGYCAGDADLVAGKIKNGVNLFGVTGTVQPPPLKTGQTTDYGTGSDGNALLQKGASRSYTDNGDGTITDNTTGLMWEKKSDDASIHDKDNTYTWGMTSSPYTMNGTMVTTFLASLNGGGGFAGYTDWRIPNRFELETLVNLQNVSPAVDTAFNSGCAASCTVTSCSCTQSNFYWSSTTYQSFPDLAWSVDFVVGAVDAGSKSYNFYVRAVRGGS